jgi:hypothetical protein
VRRQLGIGGEAELEPAADIVTSDSAATGDFVITAAPAQIASPAAATRLHPVDMRPRQMTRPTFIVGAGEDVTHLPGLVVEQAMAGI